MERDDSLFGSSSSLRKEWKKRLTSPHMTDDGQMCGDDEMHLAGWTDQWIPSESLWDLDVHRGWWMWALFKSDDVRAKNGHCVRLLAKISGSRILLLASILQRQSTLSFHEEMNRQRDHLSFLDHSSTGDTFWRAPPSRGPMWCFLHPVLRWVLQMIVSDASQA